MNTKTMLKKIINENLYGNTSSGSDYAIARELLDRVDEINNLVIVGNPWCIEKMVYTLDEINDPSMWNNDDNETPEYISVETWINEQVGKIVLGTKS